MRLLFTKKHRLSFILLFIEYLSCNAFLVQWAKAIIFDQSLNVLAQKNCPASPAELKAYLTAYDSRDNTIGAGTVLTQKLENFEDNAELFSFGEQTLLTIDCVLNFLLNNSFIPSPSKRFRTSRRAL